MKLLHKPNLYGWSVFNEDRNLDFHSVLWVRQGGNVAIDPLPLSAHDFAHIEALGGVSTIIVTNSDHVRDTARLAEATQAKIMVPEQERATLAALGAAGLKEGSNGVAGLEVLELSGSKTPGELALIIEGDTLVVGDLVRSHGAGRLHLLPDPKLADKEQALASLERLTELGAVEAVLVGDGWPVFRDGRRALRELYDTASS